MSIHEKKPITVSEAKKILENEKKKVSDLEGSLATLAEDLEETRTQVEILKRELIAKAPKKDALDVKRAKAQAELHPVGLSGVRSLRPIVTTHRHPLSP